MAPDHILIVMISSVIPENLVLLTKSEQSGPKSAHIRPTILRGTGLVNYNRGTRTTSISRVLDCRMGGHGFNLQNNTQGLTITKK